MQRIRAFFMLTVIAAFAFWLTGCATQTGVSTTQPTTQPVTQAQIDLGLANAAQVALDDAELALAVLHTSGKINDKTFAQVEQAEQLAQSLIDAWKQNAGSDLASKLQAEYQTAINSLNSIKTTAQAKS